MEFEMKTSCPDEEMLVDYIEGRISGESRYQIEKHISDCQACLEALAVTSGLLRDSDRFELDPVPNAVTEAAVNLVSPGGGLSIGPFVEQIKRSMQKLKVGITDLIQLSLLQKWQPAPIRGSKRVVSEDLVSLQVDFKEIKAQIEIEKIAREKALIRVNLPEAAKLRKTVRITLKKSEREIASYLWEGTTVLFEDIPFGHYSIYLTDKNVDLGTYLFEIKESRDG
jgi:hypothetical protein